MDLKGKTALITEASRGIGPHIAAALAGRPMNLVLTSRSGAELEEVAAEQRKHGVRVVTVDFFPGMGPWMNKQMGVTKTLREVQDFRRSKATPPSAVQVPAHDAYSRDQVE
jgi:NAD(P)-dependent dehydrogenase (short-subunit alcohol dehydrogenase family)